MHKKMKIKGHVAHKMTVGEHTFFYIVAPERESVEVYVEWPQPPIGYAQVESIHITPRMLGRHGYLQSIIKRLNEYLSGDLDLVMGYCQNDVVVTEKAFKLISKEENKMHKKTRIHGHVLHRLPKCPCLYYTVEPEHSCIAVYILMYDPVIGEHYYSEFEDISIYTALLGRPGYLQEQIEQIARRHSVPTPISDHLEREKMLNDDTVSGRLSYIKESLKALNNTFLKEEKKMTEYYVIDVEMIFADYKTTDTECLQVRQSGNYFEIPFDGPDCSERGLLRLYERLLDYVNETKEMFKIAFEKSEICSNSVLKITSPYVYISDSANREELCKILAYAVEHREYPYPICNAGLSKVCFYLRECNNQKIYEKVYSEGVDCTIRISGMIVRGGGHFDYIPVPTDVVGLKFKNGRLTHFMLAGDSSRGWEAVSEKTPGPLYHIYHHDEPFQHVEEIKSLLRDICNNRRMWKNAAYITFVVFGNQD